MLSDARGYRGRGAFPSQELPLLLGRQFAPPAYDRSNIVNRDVEQVPVCVAHPPGAERALELPDHRLKLFAVDRRPSYDRSDVLSAGPYVAAPARDVEGSA